METPQPPWQPVPMLGHPHSKKVFPDIQGEPPVLQCVSVASSHVSGCHWKYADSVLVPLYSSVRYLYTLIRLFWIFSSSDWTTSAPSTFPCGRETPVCSSSSWAFAEVSPVHLYFSYTGEPRMTPSTPDVASSVLSRGEGSHPSARCQYFI